MAVNSWLDAGLSIRIDTVDAGTAYAIRELSEEEARIAVQRAQQVSLRQRVGRLRQALWKSLAAEAGNPVQAAGAVRSLELQVETFGLNPSLFTDLHDRQTVGQLVRDVQQHSRRLTGGMTATDRARVEEAARAQLWVNELAYALQHAAVFANYTSALQFVEQHRGKQRWTTCLHDDIVWFAVSLLTMVSVPTLLYWFFDLLNFLGRGVLGSASDFWLFLGLASISVIVVIIGSVVYQYRVVRRRRTYRESIRFAEAAGRELDLQRIGRVVQQFGDPAAWPAAYENARRTVESFFGRRSF